MLELRGHFSYVLCFDPVEATGLLAKAFVGS